MMCSTFCRYFGFLFIHFAVVSCNRLQSQRLNQLREGGNAAAVSDTPNSLVRRFEVVVVPTSATRSKKLREVRAEGEYCIGPNAISK